MHDPYGPGTPAWELYDEIKEKISELKLLLPSLLFEQWMEQLMRDKDDF